ncbi:MAG: acetyl-CoA carboxylase biotin carboxyl carrier protein [Planctomycetales bacterium]|nr:acetyl-CoA carboxylase biotin carboxyl carrier protein [Planctomycetales bacterium]
MSEPDIKPESEDSVFEVQRIRRLVELMKEHDLSEIDLRESRHRIRICRGPKEAPRPVYAAPPPPPPPPPAGSQVAAQAGAKAPPADSPNTVTIKSPMVGTYYCRPNPKAEPFVKVGSKVDVNTPICIIEAMKVFNEIPAEIRGTITAILVEDGEAVEFDKPLFKVEKS